MDMNGVQYGCFNGDGHGDEFRVMFKILRQKR